MSFGRQRQYRGQLMAGEGKVGSGSGIKSDSTTQVGKGVKQSVMKHQHGDIHQYQEECQGEIYKDLSSGVYRMSRKSSLEQQEQRQNQYQSQQIGVANDFSQVRQKHNAKQLESGSEERGQRYREVEMDVASFMQKVLSPKLLSQEVLLLVLQGKIGYPSMMEQANDENDWELGQSMGGKQHQQRLVWNKPSLGKSALYSQQMNLAVNPKHENRFKSEEDRQELPETVDLLRIRDEDNSKRLGTKGKASGIQEEIEDEYGLEQKSKVVVLEEINRLRILGYQKQYFLKIQTQVFQIQFSSSPNTYTFNRKFADFVLLDKLIRLKYPGYILYPFPENNLELYDKIKLSVGTQLQKVILLEKRLLQLERYLNFLVSHVQLGASQAFKTFIAESDEQYSRHSAYLYKQVQREQQKFSSSRIKQNYKSIKNFFMSGLSYFASYVASNQQSAYNAALIVELKSKSETLKQNFDNIIAELEKNTLASNNLWIKATKLLQIYQINIQMKPIESSIDSVLRLSSKMASSKTAYQLHKNWIEDQMLSKIEFFVRIFAQVQQQIKYRKSLLQQIDQLTQEQAKLGSTLIEGVQSFDGRFVQDWQKLKTKFEKEYFEMIEQFSRKWQFHCVQMAKIWK